MKKSLKNLPEDASARFFKENSKVEEKIRLGLNYMKQLLSEGRRGQFRKFWEVRSNCLQCFKEKMSPRSRMVFWAEFITLSDEMRKMKGILDEESSFAVEQIELAIESLKREISRFDYLIAEIDPIEVPTEASTLQDHRDEYIQRQRELDLLGQFAGRLNSLREELVRTPTRIRLKNRLLGELSELRDIIFPRRKKGIYALSELFSEDIEALEFDKKHPFEAREEIKALQNFAKVIAIDVERFTRAREILSGFWDQIKERERERHEERAKEREQYRQNFGRVSPKIDLLKQHCKKGGLTWKQAQLREGEILREMGELTLGRDELAMLKKKLTQATQPLEKKRAEELKKEREEERVKKEQREKDQATLLEKLAEVIDIAESLSLDALVEKWEVFVKEDKAISSQGISKERICSRLDVVSDCIWEKQWHALRKDQSEEGIQKLHSLLDNRHKAQRKLKEALESHRKTIGGSGGGSGLSLEQSLLYQEIIQEKKLRLDAIETMIEELEERLFDLEE